MRCEEYLGSRGAITGTDYIYVRQKNLRAMFSFTRLRQANSAGGLISGLGVGDGEVLLS